MPFYTEDENDAYEDGTRALKTADARRESARNAVAALHNDLTAPKMFVQTVDPETGFPVRKTLVSGGIEYFNESHNETGQAVTVDYDIDTLLSGDVSVEDAMAQMTGSAQHGPPRPQRAAATALAVSHQVQTSLDEAFRLLGFDFLHAEPTLPDKHVQLAFSGLTSFQVPLICHAIVQTDAIVILATDKRSVPEWQEMNFNVDRDNIQAALVCPDKTSIPIVAPIPRTVSFEIGLLRCTLFVKR